MLFWIIVGIIIYLIIGIALLFYVAISECGILIFYFAVPFMLTWPYFVVKSWKNKRRSK